MKKLLIFCLLLITSCTLFCGTGCTTIKSNNTLAVSPTTVLSIKQDATKEEAFKNLKFTYKNTDNETYLVWNDTLQKNETKVIPSFKNQPYDECLKLGLLVSGFNSNNITTTDQTLTFTIYGVSCTLKYKVVAGT